MYSILMDDDISYQSLSDFIDRFTDWDEKFLRAISSGLIDDTYTMHDFMISEYNDEYRREGL